MTKATSPSAKSTSPDANVQKPSAVCEIGVWVVLSMAASTAKPTLCSAKPNDGFAVEVKRCKASGSSGGRGGAGGVGGEGGRQLLHVVKHWAITHASLQ